MASCCQTAVVSVVALCVMVLLDDVTAQFPPAQSVFRYETPCRYLTSRPSRWADNTAPFELFTRGLETEIKRGKPIEVRINPWENSIYSFENFTDFIIYAEPRSANAEGPTAWRPVGVFSIYPRYAAGGKGFRCNRGAMGYDSVGSIEERHLQVYKQRYPNDHNLRRYQPRHRKGAAFIWYPSEGAMKAEKVVFIAMIKIRHEWFRLSSREWTVFKKPNFWQTLSSQLQQMKSQMAHAETQAVAIERHATSAAAAGSAP